VSTKRGPSRRYLSLSQVAIRIGIAPTSISKYPLPEPDVIVGPVNEDGTLPRCTTRGWLPETIDAWDVKRRRRGRKW
jgi:hypothetical protein